MKQILRFNKIIKSIIIAGDLCILNALFVTLYYVLDTDTQRILLSDSLPQLLVLLNLVYLLCNYSKGVVLHRRIVRADHIVMRAVRNTFCHAVVFISLITLVHFGSLSTRFLVIFYTAFLALLVLYRLIFRHFVKIYRRKGGNRRTVALVGDGSNMVELYEEMTADPTSGFKVVGYFAEHPSDNYPKECRYLGTPQEVIPYLKKSKAEQLYCGLASSHSKEIMPIISYCENNLIHFYSVPNVRFVIVPSEWYENNPMTIIEAYSVGTPVIGAKIGGIPEIIIDGKTGYQFTTGNSDNLQETIKKIFSLTPEAYQRLSAGTLEFAHENLSLENYYPRLIAFYSHFLKQE